MTLTISHFCLSLLLLAIPACVLWILDRRLLRQSVLVIGRVALVLALLAVCFYYLFRWDSPWLNMLWVLLSGGVAVAVYCRKRWLAVPVFVASSLSVSLFGLFLLLWTNGGGALFKASYFLPVMAVLQADALYLCRRGMTAFTMNLHRHGSLQEYLLANGVSQREALRPFYAQAVKRAMAPVLSQLLLVGAVFMPSLLAGMLLCGVEPLKAVAFLFLLMVTAICCSLLALLGSIWIYLRLKS